MLDDPSVAPKSMRRSKKEGLKHILAAAGDEFCRRGLAGAKLDVIALEAGVSKQLIHHYFRTKAELYVAVIEEVSALAIEELSRPDYEALPPREAVRMFLHGVFDLFERRTLLAGLFNDQSLYGGEHIPESRGLKERSPELMERLSRIFRVGQQAGIFKDELKPDAVFAAAIMVVSGNFTGGKIISAFVPVDYSAADNLAFWRDFATDFALDAMSTDR